MVNFQTTVIYDEVFYGKFARLLEQRTFRDREIFSTTFQEEQQKAIDMVFEGNNVSVSLTTDYGKSVIYQAAQVIGRLSSLETGHYVYRATR